MNKKLLSLSVVFFLLSFVTHASEILVKPESPLANYLDEIAFYEYQIGAVMEDMLLYIAWDVDDKKNMAIESKIALEHLDMIIADISSLGTPEEASFVRTDLVDSINDLKAIYTNIEKKDRVKVGEELAVLGKKYKAYQEKMGKKFKLDIGDEVKSAQEPRPVFSTKELDVEYAEALDSITQKNYVNAYKVLSSLKGRVDTDTASYDYVVFNITEVLGKSSYTNYRVVSEKENEEEMIKQYAEDIFKKEYSPLFFELFVRWRTLEQSMNHGLSNWSEIPNWEYNLKRKGLINKIKIYLKNNPMDNWARIQMMQLLGLDNIMRGGPMGNNVLNYLGVLYMDLQDKE